ncbi:MAG: hypothetical protein UU76_C0032G0004 [Parcubacteria group bacterium GW2011_GWC1_41_7]|nr:MAG: hypothetical protein UU76_C0032G0004 [Parcubacteria group bacterium GW2011_GWC1_41_7]
MIKKVFAQGKEVVLPPLEIPGPFGKVVQAFNAGHNFGFIIGNIFKVILIAGGLWTLFQLFQAGLNWISSGGEAKAVEAARNRLTYALLGIFIIAASWGLIILVEQMFGACFGFSCEIDLTQFANPD